MLGFCLVWSCSCLVHAVVAPVTPYMQLSCCIQKTQFHLSYALPLALTIFLFPGGREYYIDIPSKNESSKVSYCLCVDQLHISMLISTYCKRLLIILNLTAKTLDMDYKSCLVSPCLPSNLILYSSYLFVHVSWDSLGSSSELLSPEILSADPNSSCCSLDLSLGLISSGCPDPSD